MKSDRVKLSKWVTPVFETSGQASHWFGYYNYSPMDLQGRRLLAHRAGFDGRVITADDTVEVGWFGLADGEWHALGRTRAFNWQQGAMLQWLGPDYASRVIYNDVEDGHFVARVVDVNSGARRTVPWPVYAVTPSGGTSISLQFERSYWCRAYHYESVCNPLWNVPAPADDGVFSVDLDTGKVQRIVALEEVMRIDPEPDFAGKSHWIEHVMLNPSGKRFAFYHRFGQGDAFQTRVFTADLNGKGLYLCPGWRENMCSHMGWKDDREFVLFSCKAAAVGHAHAAVSKCGGLGSAVLYAWRHGVKPWFPQRVSCALMQNTSYRRLVDGQGVVGQYAEGQLKNDGHPSFTPDGAYMLTDTYADHEGYRHLLLFDTVRDRLHELGRFFSPYNGCSYRSDLHPRFSRDHQAVIIDTAHSGKHQMMVLRLDWDAITEA